MMMAKNLVAIATNDNALLFRSLGFVAYIVEGESEVRRVVEQVSATALIIVIDEALESALADIRSRYEEQTFPIIVALPFGTASSGRGLAKLRSDVEKAIGIDLF